MSVYLDDESPFPTDAFRDVLEGNEEYARDFVDSDLGGRAVKHLAVVTCMDSRIDPLNLLGMQPGDVKIIRNAGARVTADVLRTLVLATHLLDVNRVLVMPHTHCKMASGDEADIHALIKAQYGRDTRSVEIHTVSDQLAALRTDVTRIRAFPLLPEELVVGGVMFDVHTGLMHPVDI